MRGISLLTGDNTWGLAYKIVFLRTIQHVADSKEKQPSRAEIRLIRGCPAIRLHLVIIFIYMLVKKTPITDLYSFMVQGCYTSLLLFV